MRLADEYAQHGGIKGINTLSHIIQELLNSGMEYAQVGVFCNFNKILVSHCLFKVNKEVGRCITFIL